MFVVCIKQIKSSKLYAFQFCRPPSLHLNIEREHGETRQNQKAPKQKQLLFCCLFVC